MTINDGSDKNIVVLKKTMIGVILFTAALPFTFDKQSYQHNLNINNNINNNNNNNNINNNISKRMNKKITSQIMTVVPQYLVKYSVFEYLHRSSNTSINCLAGVLAGAAEVVFVSTPINTIKTNSRIDGRKTIDTIKYLWNRDKFLLFWKNSDVQIKMINNGLTYGIFQQTNQIMHRHMHPYFGKSTGLVAGYIGASMSVLICNPISVIEYERKHTKTKIITHIDNIYKNHGISGFYNGSIMKIIKIGSLHSIGYFMYDILNKIC